MRFPVTIVAFMAASLTLWNGLQGRAPESTGAAVPALASAPAAGSAIQVESGTPMRIRLDGRAARALRSGAAWEGWTAVPVVMLRADAAPAGAGRLVLDEVLIPARTHVAGIVTAVRALSPRGTLIAVRVRARDSRGRSVALNATGGGIEDGAEPEMHFTVHEIVRVE